MNKNDSCKVILKNPTKCNHYFRYYSLMDNIDNIIIYLSIDLKIQDLNKKAEDVFLWRKKFVLGKKFKILCKKSNIQSPLPKDLSQVFFGIPCENIETSVSQLNNKSYKIIWSLKTLFDKKNKPHALLLIGYNITQQKALENELDYRSAYLQDIIAKMPNNIYWMNRNLIYQGCNNNVAKTLGLGSPKEIIGKTYEDFAKISGIDFDRIKSFKKDDIEVISSGKPKLNIEEPPIITANGSTKYFLTNRVPLIDDKKNIIGVIGISIDITDRKLAEKALQEAKNKAEEANNIKSQFIKNMEHDLRTPASGIASLSELLMTKETDIEKKTTLKLLANAGEQLLNILNNILEFDRINYGSFPILAKKFNIKKLVENIIKLETPSARMKDLDLKTYFSADVPDTLIGDEFRISRILINLVSNSIKFTPKGYVLVQVDLAHQKNKKVIIKMTVKDTGVGVPKDKQDFIFEKFSRISPANTGLYGGSGLGLCYVKQFTEELNGEIDLESDPKYGTTFTCLIPLEIPILVRTLKKKTKQPRTSITKAGIISSKLQKTKNITTFKQLKLMLVEDNKIAQTIAENILKDSFTCTVDLSDTGNKSIVLTDQKKYDIIFLDIGLPDMSGLEVIQVIRKKSKKNKLTPIIALTAHDDKDTKDSCIQAGFTDYLVKPINKEKATFIINKWLCQHSPTKDKFSDKLRKRKKT